MRFPLSSVCSALHYGSKSRNNEEALGWKAQKFWNLVLPSSKAAAEAHQYPRKTFLQSPSSNISRCVSPVPDAGLNRLQTAAASKSMRRSSDSSASLGFELDTLAALPGLERGPASLACELVERQSQVASGLVAGPVVAVELVEEVGEGFVVAVCLDFGAVVESAVGNSEAADSVAVVPAAEIAPAAGRPEPVVLVGSAGLEPEPYGVPGLHSPSGDLHLPAWLKEVV